MSLRPGSKLDTYVEMGLRKSPTESTETHISRSQPGLSQLIQRLEAKDGNGRKESHPTLLLPSTEENSSSASYVSNGQLPDSTHCSPPKTENEVSLC